MVKKVHIIHSSSIVQNGLEAILLKNFRCVVKCYDNLNSFEKSEDRYTTNCVLFIENDITKQNDFQESILLFKIENIFKIIANKVEVESIDVNSSIFLNDSLDEIYEIAKVAFQTNKLDEEKLEDLTNREIEVLKLIALGNSNKEIAEKLFISTHTVMSHRKNMTEKLGIKSISGLTVYAIMNNYIDTSNLETNNLI